MMPQKPRPYQRMPVSMRRLHKELNSVAEATYLDLRRNDRQTHGCCIGAVHS